jgi:hypothetical protein
MHASSAYTAIILVGRFVEHNTGVIKPSSSFSPFKDQQHVGRRG